MSIPKETQERINFLFKTNPEMIEKLYNCDDKAIREVGSLSQKKIDPTSFILAYESGDPSSMNDIYQQAKRLVGLQELYKELCFEYYKKTKDIPGHVEQSTNQNKSI